jgi:di/tricarboxylate transporter
MTQTQWLLIAIVLFPLLLVIFNRLRMDVAAIIMAIALGIAQFAGLGMLGGVKAPLDAVQALSGLGQPIIFVLISLFVITQAFNKSGLTHWIARKLIDVGGSSETRLIGLFALTTGLLSLFMNNLAAGALVLPSAMEVARRTKIRPSKLLIPVAYGSLLGGTATYFTTANIIVSDLLRIAHPPQAPLNILDFTPTGGLILVAGVLFLAVFGKRLLPDRRPSSEQMFTQLTGSELEDLYHLGERLWEAHVREGSPMVGKTLAESRIGKEFGVAVAALWRGRHPIFTPAPIYRIQADDVMLLVGREDHVTRLREEGLSVIREATNGHISTRGIKIFEILLSPHSKATGKTIKEIDLRRQSGFTAIAVQHRNEIRRTDIGDIKLSMGDSLLVVGSRERVRSLKRDPDFIILEPSLSDQPINRGQAFFTIGVIAAAITASAFGFPVYLAMMIGALVIILSGGLSMEEAYRSVEWQAVFLVAGMYAVSLAMVNTGLAVYFGNLMLSVITPLGPLGLAAGAYLVTSILTQAMGGQVTALVTGPILISAAIDLGVSPQAIAVATAIGCSASFFTPLAHPVNILMIAPANYRFGDFFRVGWILTIVCFIMLMAGMFIFWGLRWG